MSLNDDGIKVILLGETFVGKTSLINVSIDKHFKSKEEMTLSFNYSLKKFNYKGKEYIFNLWDTIGQEKYRSLTKMFINDSKIVILVYDITIEKSFKQLEYWYNQVNSLINEQDYILAVVGNKKDLFKDEKVSEEQGKAFAMEKNAKFKLTSAKDDPLSFVAFLEELFKDFIDKGKEKLDKKIGKKLNNEKYKKKSKCC